MLFSQFASVKNDEIKDIIQEKAEVIAFSLSQQQLISNKFYRY